MAYTSADHPVLWRVSHSSTFWIVAAMTVVILVAGSLLEMYVPIAEIVGFADPNQAP